MERRIEEHPILGETQKGQKVAGRGCCMGNGCIPKCTGKGNRYKAEPVADTHTGIALTL